VAEVGEGARAPQFTLPAVNVEKIGMEGDTIALKDFKGEKIVVLYFYPRDNTKGCTLEATGFRDLKGQFTRNGAVILGVSTDDLASHEKFIEKQKLNFPLLSDEDGKVAEKYGISREEQDEVAYLRFASVYRSFSSAEDFEREIEALRAHRGAGTPG